MRNVRHEESNCATLNYVTATKGKHTLVVVFKAANPDDKVRDLMNLEWFVFENKNTIACK